MEGSMRLIPRLAAASLMLLAPGAVLAQVTTETVPGVTNFRHVESTVACAGATTPEAMKAIKDMGFASVVNLREASEKDVDLDAASASARTAGLKYIHIPMNGASPDPAVLDRFVEAARAAENQPMFVHCATGNRAAAVWLAKRVLVDGWPTDRAVEEAEALGLRSAPLKQFALDYVKAHQAR
jgi:uncharacterized protein (TIGR01244 family)